ncbi:MAG: Mini-ribonuclease 3 [Eubacterium sp.]
MVKKLGTGEELRVKGEDIIVNSDLFHIIKESMELKDIDIVNYSPLTLAYIGDGIYEIVIRTVIVDEANCQVNKIHKAASELVKAQTQAELAFLLMDRFTQEEQVIYKRGRNAKAVTRAKHASMSDYRTATGFEALIGWLYLTGQSERMLSLIKQGLNELKMQSEQ